MTLEERLRHLLAAGDLELPYPGGSQTALRHRRLAEFGRKDLSLARLAEAHVDAVSILAEAGLAAEPGALYGVWASEIPNQPLRLEPSNSGFALNGSKMFCTGARLLDRALVTVCLPEQRLIDVNLRQQSHTISFDASAWVASAFGDTDTATATFRQREISQSELIGAPGWYLERPGFWHGACGPAACWAGGAIGLVDYALQQSRSDSHTLAHLGAMTADTWALDSYLDSAGREIDSCPEDREAARLRALKVRHLIESACSDILHRFARAYGPRPLAFDAEASRRYQELQLFIRQSHAERDLEVLGGGMLNARREPAHTNV